MPVAPGELQPNGWLPVDPSTGNSFPWAEAISRTGSMSDGQLGYEGGCHFSVPIFCYWSDLQKAIPAILGTNLVNFDSNQIDRVPPIQHPIFPQMFASRITSIKGVKFTGKARKLAVAPSNVPVAGCKLVLLTILFEQPKYSVLNDNELDAFYPPIGGIRQEWMRFVEIIWEPSAEEISREGGSFTFVEGSNGIGFSNQPTANVSKFSQTAGQKLTKPTIVMRWHKVPQVGLFSGGGMGPPTNLFAAIGTVNNEPFPVSPSGYTTGTLLLLPPKFTVQPTPLPNDTGVGNIGGTYQLYYTVDLPLLLFQPPSGFGTDGPNQGHNLFPWPDGYWYLAKNTNGLTQTLFPYSDFKKIFLMNP